MSTNGGSPHFANSYWSPDYITGIEKLDKLSINSLGQVHELRKFVFNYMKYFHSNGEHLAQLSISSYPYDSCYRSLRGQRNISGFRKVSSSSIKDESLEFDLNYAFRSFVEHTSSESRSQQQVASEIDSVILHDITAFLKHYEPLVNQSISDLFELYNDYRDSYETLEAAKQHYANIIRVGEITIKHPTSQVKEVSLNSERAFAKPEHKEDAKLEDMVDFPIVVSGANLFETAEDLINFLSLLISSISVIKRKIPLPGYRNEIFSSEQLCEQMRLKKPRSLNPSRSNLEKLGQVLLDTKILISTGIFAKKFNSEGMWFEWSNLALAACDSGSKLRRTISPSSVNSRNDMSSSKGLDAWNSMTHTTSKTIDGVFKSMQKSLSKAKFSEQDLIDAELKYNTSYETVQRQKHLLEMKILEVSNSIENFEKVKIQLIFKSLSNLSKVMRQFGKQSNVLIEAFYTRVDRELNNSANCEAEFAKSLTTTSSGVYFPSFLEPSSESNKHLSTAQLNTNFQNIKHGFNLYKDISLQITYGACNPENVLLSIKSTPVFIVQTFANIERFANSEICDVWKEPLNYQQYWLMKDDLIHLISGLNPAVSSEVYVKSEIEYALVSSASKYLEDKNLTEIVNFLKNWLLEISDSVIPSTVYDSLITNYIISMKENVGEEKRVTETLKVLGNIPRSNLSSLVYILEHISRAFGLDQLSGYGEADEFDHIEPSSSEESLRAVSTKLNSISSIGSVPFIHLIMRPSVVKHSRGFIPPLEQYNALFADLLALTTREKLCQTLLVNERNFMARQNQKKHNFGLVKKQELRDKMASTSSNQRIISESETLHISSEKDKDLSSSSPMRSKANFELRPFRTGTTPRPSRATSPENTNK